MTSISARFVLQGEFAVVKKGQEEVRTAKPESCTLVTLFSQTAPVAVVARFAPYTSPFSFLDQINKVLYKKHQTSLKKCSFRAKILVTQEDTFSEQQGKTIKKLLKGINIPSEYLPKMASQITFNPVSGICSASPDSSLLESCQQRQATSLHIALIDEYLDDYIPSFKIQESNPQKKAPLKRTKNAADFMKKMECLIDKITKDLQIKCETACALKADLNTNNFQDFFWKVAAYEGYEALLEYMLTHQYALEIDVSAKNSDDFTIFQLAELHKNTPVLALLNSFLHTPKKPAKEEIKSFQTLYSGIAFSYYAHPGDKKLAAALAASVYSSRFTLTPEAASSIVQKHDPRTAKKLLEEVIPK